MTPINEKMIPPTKPAKQDHKEGMGKSTNISIRCKQSEEKTPTREDLEPKMGLRERALMLNTVSLLLLHNEQHF
jgi:hypothetical protein